MIIRQQKSERGCAPFHVSALKTKVLIIICAAKLLYCNGFAKQGGVKNVKESVFLSFLSNKASFLPMCVRLRPHFFLSTSYFFAHESFFVAHESHESSRIHCLYYNGDLFGRTNFTNSISSVIEFV